MHVLRSRKGYTLVEGVFAVGIMSLVGFGALAMMVGSVACFDNTSTEAFTDTHAVLAMQAIVSDVREAKSISILDSGARLSVVFPIMTSGGYYDRHTLDPTSQVDYYVSDSTGALGRTGTWLWRNANSGALRVLKKDVTSMLFEQDTSRSVKITIVARNRAASGDKETQLTQRVVYLRNY